MRQRMYSRGGSGRNGGWRYQPRGRKPQARRSRSTARRGVASACSARRRGRHRPLAGGRRRLLHLPSPGRRRGASAELRRRYARVIGATPEEIALGPSISVALASVAEALDYGKRRRVVVTSLDFPTVAYQWLAKRARGIELVVVESPDQVTVPVEMIARAVDERTALVATSHVYFTSGAIQDIAAVAEAAHASGALCLIDAYQSVGQVPVEVHTSGVDFLTAGGLKWLLGGPGVVFLYAREELARRLMPGVAGRFGHRDQFAFDPRRLEFHDDARRFELGTPALAAIYAQLGGLDYIDEIGVPAIRGVAAALTEDLIARARERGLQPKVAAHPQQRSAVVMLPAADPAARVRLLAEAGGGADARPRRLRLCPFFSNVQDDHVAALERLATRAGH